MSQQKKQFKQWALEHKGTLVFAGVAVLLCVYYTCCLPGNNIFNWIRASHDVHLQNKEIEYYNSQIEQMDREIDALSNNKDTLERFAREEYNYASPGDDVYILRK